MGKTLGCHSSPAVMCPGSAHSHNLARLTPVLRGYAAARMNSASSHFLAPVSCTGRWEPRTRRPRRYWRSRPPVSTRGRLQQGQPQVHLARHAQLCCLRSATMMTTTTSPVTRPRHASEPVHPFEPCAALGLPLRSSMPDPHTYTAPHSHMLPNGEPEPTPEPTFSVLAGRLGDTVVA